MKLSHKEAQQLAFKILDEAEKRRSALYEENCVVTSEEDVDEEVLIACRRFANDNYDVPGFEGGHPTNDWIEAGDQYYAEFRGWA